MIKNRAHLDHVKTLPCLVCKSTPSDPDHITTRGAGGGDEESNVWPLCRRHHVERHNKGIYHMIWNYRSCEQWLITAGRTDVLDRAERKRNEKV